MAATGTPSDINPLVTATKDVAFRNIDEQARGLQSQFGSQGNRYSSDVYRGAGLVRERGTQDLNESLLQLAFGAAESAQGRKLAASELLGNLAGSARQSALSPIALALGQSLPNVQPSGTSQAIAQLTPAVAYGLSSRSGGKGGSSQPQGNFIGPNSGSYWGNSPGKG